MTPYIGMREVISGGVFCHFLTRGLVKLFAVLYLKLKNTNFRHVNEGM
jgi:hypothetical protein